MATTRATVTRLAAVLSIAVLGSCTGDVRTEGGDGGGGRDGATPPPRDGTVPGVDGMIPGVDGAIPGVDGTIPGVDGGPGMDGGPTGTDGGPMGTDGGPMGTDGGPMGMDGGPPPGCVAPTLPSLATTRVGGTFNRPVFVTQAPGVTDTLWVVEQGAGTSSSATALIRLVRGGTTLGAPFLSITVDRSGNERGLLGMAFHPGYASNRRFFLFYNSPGGGGNRTVVGEFRRSASNPDVAEPAEVRRLMDFADAESNHNGGMIQFGSDGFLYVAVGDGGSGCDPHGTNGNGQNLMSVLGKIHRLDVDNVAGGFVAAGNPFASGGGLATIWSYGLRNPWRFAFDRMTDDMYIGDVGQGTREEIDFQPASSSGGENYGWRFFEGTLGATCGDSAAELASITHEAPIYELDRAGSPLLRGACSVTGGFVYRGAAIPALRGVYFFGDYCSADIGAFRYCDGAVRGAQRVADLGGIAGGLSSFGEDNAGEIYLIYLGDGEVHRIVPGP